MDAVKDVGLSDVDAGTRVLSTYLIFGKYFEAYSVVDAILQFRRSNPRSKAQFSVLERNCVNVNLLNYD